VFFDVRAMEINETLQGIWTFRRAREGAEEDLFMEILADGRIVQFYKQHPSLAKYIAMTMRACAETGAENAFRIKTSADAAGYLITMRRDGAYLAIVNRSETFVCRPVSENELPTWYGEVRREAVWR
jgi:hypothetical protein